MLLTTEQMIAYEEQGYLLIPNLFSEDEVLLLKNELPRVFSTDYPGRVFEKDTNLVRGIHGPHFFNEIYSNLSRHPRIVESSMQLLNSDVYIHQFKINAKAAFGGDIWEWHQDYQYWRDEDGMMTPRAVNAAVFLDDVTEFNGPLILIPGSQQFGVIETIPRENETLDEPSWLATVRVKLKYTITKETLTELTKQHELTTPKGKRGSVLFFHPNVVHGSAPNMSPYDRVIAIITYNSVENKLRAVYSPRPDFMASRVFEPIIPIEDNVFQVS